MTRPIVTLIVAASSLLPVGSLAAENNARDSASKGVIRLFNGKNLDGWYTFLRDIGKNKDPHRVFTVKDGLLRISGLDWGCITTEKEYENYRLIAEFKWGRDTHEPRVDRARDSGFLIHSIGKDGGYGRVWMTGIEFQIIEGGTGDFLAVGDKTERFALTCPVAEKKAGSSYVFQPDGKPVTIHGGRINWWGRDPGWKDLKGFRGARDVEKPVGQWNRIECVADGDTLTAIVNGVVVNRALVVKPNKGRIQVQSEGAEVFYRRIDLIPLAGAK